MCIISKNEANSQTNKKVYDTYPVTPKYTFLVAPKLQTTVIFFQQTSCVVELGIVYTPVNYYQSLINRVRQNFILL